MPFTATLIAGGVNATVQAIAAARQKRQANRVRVQDSTTPEDREALANARQNAYADMPGYGTAMQDVDRGFQQGVASLGQGAVSAGGFLSGLTRFGANRDAALRTLRDQNTRWHYTQQAPLQNQLVRFAERRRADMARAAAEKAALTESSNRNLFGALSTAGTTATTAALLKTPAPDVATPVVGAGGPTATQLALMEAGVAPPLPSANTTAAYLLRRRYNGFTPYANSFLTGE